MDTTTKACGPDLSRRRLYDPSSFLFEALTTRIQGYYRIECGLTLSDRLICHLSFGETSMTTPYHRRPRNPSIPLIIALILFQTVIFQMIPVQESAASDAPLLAAPVKSSPSLKKSVPLHVSIQGEILSGSLPVKGAMVYLYKSRRLANRTPLSLSKAKKTDSLGRFSFHFLPPSDHGLVYVVIKGGESGGGQNPFLSMIAPVWMANGAIPRTPVIRTVNSRVFSTAVATFLSSLERDRIFGKPERLASIYAQYRGEIDLQSGRFETDGFESSLSLASQTTLSGWARAASLCANHPDRCHGLFLKAVYGTNEVVPQDTLDFLEGAGGFTDQNQDRILRQIRHRSARPPLPPSTLSVSVTLSGSPLPGSRVTLTAIDLQTSTRNTVASGISDKKGEVTLRYVANPQQRFCLTAWGTIRKGTSNPAIRLISLLPAHPLGKNLTPSPDRKSVPVVINEMTTLAAVNALKQAFTDDMIDPAPISAVGFQNGWTLATKLVSPDSGTPSISESTLSVTSALLGLCHKPSGLSCQKLFSLLSTQNHPVKDTLEASLSLLNHPERHKKRILALLPSGRTDLSDFLLKVALPERPSEKSCRGQQGSMALDSRGSMWEICSGPQRLVRISPDSRSGKGLVRVSSDLIPGSGAALLSIDPHGNLWIAEKRGLMERSPNGNLRIFPGIRKSPLAMVQNPATHTIWVSEENVLDIFDDQGKILQRIPEAGVKALAADDDGNIWASIRDQSLVLELDPDSNIAGRFKRTAGISHPSTMAIDSNGHVWIGNHDPDSITGLTHGGNPVNQSPISGGGINDPEAIAIDGENTMWIANAEGNSLSAFSQDQTPLSREKGFRGGGLSGPSGIATDRSGNIWVENHPEKGSERFITLVIGAASPQTTPISLSPR